MYVQLIYIFLNFQTKYILMAQGSRFVAHNVWDIVGYETGSPSITEGRDDVIMFLENSHDPFAMYLFTKKL